MCKLIVVHVISRDPDGGATEADGGASAPLGPTVATPLAVSDNITNYSYMYVANNIILCICI